MQITTKNEGEVLGQEMPAREYHSSSSIKTIATLVIECSKWRGKEVAIKLIAVVRSRAGGYTNDVDDDDVRSHARSTI